MTFARAELPEDRSRYFRLAYRMLGSRAEAEDVVQEAYLKVGTHPGEIAEPARYLMRTVANLCVDRLRAERVRRRAYVGPWLPEPLVSDEAPDATAELAESLAKGFMLLLERLSPAERIVFVLREGFDLDFGEIAELLDVGAAACRQRFARARRRLHDRSTEPPRPAAHRDLLERLMTAIAGQDADAVVALLGDDALLISDGGGVVAAAIRPVEGRERIARVLVHIAARLAAGGGASFRFANVNGDWGVVVLQDGAIDGAMALETRSGAIRRIFLVRNPAKLVGVRLDRA